MSENPTLEERLASAKDFLFASLEGRAPHVGLILGSGLGPLAERIENPLFVPFGDVPFMKSATAVSHVGRFVIGELSGKEIICMQGRLHGYEGNTSDEVVFPVRLMHALGVQTLIVTNAAGAINESYSAGDFCVIADHINFTGRNPVVGVEAEGLAPRFFSMLDAYDPDLRALALRKGRELNLPMHEGVYLGLTGPSFETAAEIRAFRIWGADTVAMSIVEEVIAARHLGMKVLGVSLCSNMACGVENNAPSGEEVFAVAKMRSEDFCALMSSIVLDI